jgi:thiopurine S-methyltransferase
MEPSFWQGKWRRGEIGFHQAEYGGALTSWWPTLGLATAAPLLVPLCGKSLDMRYLSDLGHPVVGVELSALACAGYFEEQRVPCERRGSAPFEVYTGGNVSLFCGDFFALKPSDTAPIAGYYDRASLIALPQAERARYVGHLEGLLPSGAEGLVVTAWFPEGQKKGPPFPITNDDVLALYEPGFEVALLETVDILDREPRFRERWGVSELLESVLRVRRRSANR